MNGKPPIVPAGLKAVVFDLDGTLYTIKGLRFFIALGLWRETRALKAIFPVRDEMREKDFGDRKAFKAAFAESLGKRCGLDAARALDWYEHRFMTRFIEVLSRRGRVRPGLIPLLERLRSRRLHVAVVSDFGCVEERLSALSIPPSLFDDLIGAEDLGVMKPAAKPFLHLAAKWGISPSRMILVGDRADHDLGCAKAAGTAFIGIENSRFKGESFFSWEEVSTVLAELA